MADLLVVVDDVSEVVPSAVVCFPDAHGVVREVDIAVVAEKFRHGESLLLAERNEGSRLPMAFVAYGV